MDIEQKNKIDEYSLTIRNLKNGIISLLHRNDRMGMFAGIESRFPYLRQRTRNIQDLEVDAG